MDCMRLPAALLAALLLNGCAMLPGQQGNVYDLQREAQLAYGASEDDRAERLLLGLSRAAPNDPEAWFYLGNLYARTGRPELAVDAYQKTLMLNRGDARAWHNIGVVRLREAWAAFIQAFNASTPDNPMLAKVEVLISAMEKIPLEGLSRTARAPAGASLVSPAAPVTPAAAPATPSTTPDAKK
jgi:tetratricopeptide (TPR) repeat protein